MNTITKLVILASLVASSLFGGEDNPTKQEIEAMLRKKESYEYNLVGEKLLRPLDEALLKRIVATPPDLEFGKHDSNLLRYWLLRIAAEGDRKYLWLLDSKRLQKDDMSNHLLLAYDCNANGNQKALQTLLDRARKVMRDHGTWHGGPCLFALAAVNEWEQCRQELASHDLSADGAGDDERYGFWLKRRYFFPDNKSFPGNYAAFCRDLEQLQTKAEQGSAGQPANRSEPDEEGGDKSQSESDGRSR